MGYHMNDFAGRVARYRQELAALADARDALVAARLWAFWVWGRVT